MARTKAVDKTSYLQVFDLIQPQVALGFRNEAELYGNLGSDNVFGGGDNYSGRTSGRVSKKVAVLPASGILAKVEF
ncbi:hypothetical protein F2Q69_00052544 [Brassica cretica]|uniref:Uncharacterized protein n=1 Tax=Brassica cretica TaxID=69181 RepID=A0A8S9N1Y7_BRACR|nr:hypothetical protein F2Q69_00052544 [Brassica cretica]